MKITRTLGVFVFICVFVFFPISFPTIIAQSQGVNVEEITDYQEWNESRIIDKDVIIRSGATLVIGKGVEINFVTPWIGIIVEGNFLVKGTLKEPVVIKSDLVTGSFSITTTASSNVMIRNAEISNGGSAAYLVRGVMNKVSANSYRGSLEIDGGEIDVQNTTFKNNLYAVIVNSSDAIIRVNRSRFIDNNFDVEVNGNGNSNVDFQYNWWGNINGPEETCFVYNNKQQCYYEKIYGAFNFSNWLIKENFRDPVLIVPGILGSEEGSNNKWVLDPVLHTFDNLIADLEKNGYEQEKNLFLFPYEWRDSNVENAKLLQQKIDEIKQLRHWPKVDIVAHSMGGLLAREYIESSYYGNDIDQLITLGTPQLGAPESYLRWERGIGLPSLQEILFSKQMLLWVEHDGYNDTFDYIHNRPISSLQELLPVYDYLFDIDQKALRAYPNYYPRNQFLENLNNKLDGLDKVEFTKIIGKLGNNESSMAAFNVINIDKGKYWIHGYPDNIESIIGDKGIGWSDGDGTVPIDSAKGIASDQEIEINSSHQKLPSKASDIIYNVLTNYDSIANIDPLIIHSILFVPVFSPVDIQIIAPDGSRMGKNFETGGIYNEIPGAYYTGYDTKNEFITIPNPVNGEYQVLTQGTATGNYRVEVSKITEVDVPGGEAKESTVTLRGTTELDVREEKKIELANDDTVVAVNEDTLPPITTLASAGTRGTGDWYTSDVAITLSAKDDENGSGIEKTKYSLDNGVIWNTYTSSIILSNEGTTRVKYFSTDNVGNKEEMKTQEIKIDKTAPEAKIIFNPDTQKIDIIGIDNLGRLISVVSTESALKEESKHRSEEHHWYDRLYWKGKNQGENERNGGKKIITTTLTDEAGHTTVIILEGEASEKNHLKWTVQSLSYDDISTEVRDTKMQYEWQKNWRGQYLKIDTHFQIPEMNLNSRYSQKKNETQITTEIRDSENEDEEHDDKQKMREKMTGMIIPSMITEKGMVKINY